MNRLAAWNFDEASGDVLDVSGNEHNFPLVAPNIRTNSGHTDKGLTQSGSDSFSVPGSILDALKTPSRTICAWIQETEPITGWVGQLYVSSIDSGSWGILFLSGQWHIQARNSSGFVRASVARPTDSLFHHIAGTYDGTNVKLYLDGVLVATQSLSGPLRTDADDLRVLQNSTSSIVVDDLQYFDVDLSPAEVLEAMEPVISGRSGKPKVWDGLSWSKYQAKIWNGSAWVPASMAGYDGTQWVVSR